MKVSIVGTGRMGTGITKVMSEVYKGVIWGSRNPDKVESMIRHHQYAAVAATYDEAFQADVILHTLWFRDVIPWARDHAHALQGKILVDIANPFTDDFADFTLPWGTSAAEELQRVIPETRIVGAFKNTFWEVFNNPLHNGKPSDVYVTSNDEDAKRSVLTLLEPLPFHVLDAGSLANNRTIERMTLLEREIAIRYGHYPRVSFNIWGR